MGRASFKRIAVFGLWCALLGACQGARDSSDADAELDEALMARAMLLAPTSEPVFFWGSEPSAPAMGFGSEESKLIVREDPSENGRTPVRVLGRLHLEAYVPDGLVELRVQENASVEGTALVLRAGDRVGLIEPRNNTDVHRVSMRIAVANQVLGPFEGRLPAKVLSAKPPVKRAPLQAGIAYALPVGEALPLYYAPRDELMTLVNPMQQALPVTVLGIEGNWFLVRVGKGPYLQGYTNAPLSLVGERAKARTVKALSADKGPENQVPWRIAQTPGPLALVSAGTQLRFKGRIVATLRSSGWARVLGSTETEDVEVFLAVDDAVSVRGVVPQRALTLVSEEDLGLTPAPGPGFAHVLGAAR